MTANESGAHPWMGNSLASVKQAMLDEIGVATIEELFEQIPVSYTHLTLPTILRV